MGVILGIAALLIWWRFDSDIKLARARVANGGTLIATRCGPYMAAVAVLTRAWLSPALWPITASA
jgi:hypothetical protein